MPKIGDLELSNTKLAVRIIGGLILAGLILFLFYYLPSHLTQIVSPYVSGSYIPYLNNLVSELTNSGIPLLGVLLAVIVFFDVLLKDSWIYGIDLIITGLLFLVYDIFLYRTGQFFSFGPETTQSPIYSEITPLFSIIIIILLIWTVYSISRGVSLVLHRNQRRRSAIELSQK
jgi:hypothetical protein